MTEDQINAVLNRVKTWPRDRQEDAVQVLLTLERISADLHVPDAEDRAAIEAALAEIARGEEPASEAEVQAVFRKYS